MEHQGHEACIDQCRKCHDICQDTLFNHCLTMGGKHVDPAHVKIMADCIQACQTSADFLNRGSSFHALTCSTCADICEACAESCERIGGEEMKRCAEACRACAKSCREMGNMKKAA